MREAELRGARLVEQAQKKVSQLEDSIRGLKLERDTFERKLRSMIEQHLKLLEMHRQEEQIADKLTFIKQKPTETAPGS
jgi:hypothetical protein